MTSKAGSQLSVDSALVKKVKVATNGRDPLVTRVVMDLSADATYHVERSGPAGRDLDVVFEPPTAATDRVMLAPPDAGARGTRSARPADQHGAGDPERGGDHAGHRARGPDDGARQRTPRHARRRACARRDSCRQACRAGSDARASAQGDVDTPCIEPAYGCARTSADGTRSRAAADRRRGEALHRPPGQPRLPGRRPPRGAARLRRDQRSQHGHRPGRAGHGRRHPERRAVGSGARHHPARQQLGYTVDGTIVRIAPLDTLRKEQDSRQALAKSAADAGELARPHVPAQLRASAAAAPLVKKAGALGARRRADRRSHQHADHHRPAGELRHRVRAHLRRSIAPSRRSKSKRASSRPPATSRARSASSGASTAASMPDVGNTTSLAFPNKGTLGGRLGAAGFDGSARVGDRADEHGRQPRRARRDLARSAWRSARSTARSTSTSRSRRSRARARAASCRRRA